MNITPASIKDILIIEPRVFEDTRGFFMETYHMDRYLKSGINQSFVQDNLSFSLQNTLRGLHYQIKTPQAKLIQVIQGEIFDVAVDIRPKSPTFRQWVGIKLSEKNKRQVLIPAGFAHGFCVLSKTAFFSYKCSNFYNPEDEGGILWSDPAIGIDWPVKNPIISEKDLQNPLMSDLTSE